MRTTTLLIAAAALAATVTASKAQTVYSQNVVGYINVTIPNGGFVTIANQLDTGSNTINNVFQTGGVSGNTALLEWNGTKYSSYTYENSSTSGYGTGWFAGSHNFGATNIINPGYGFLIRNTSGGSITLPTVGQVTQGTNIYTILPGLYAYSIPEPLAGTALDNANVKFPVVNSLVSYLTWNGTKFSTYTYENSSTSGYGTGWFAGTHNIENVATDWPSAGGSFFIRNSSGATLYWTNVFEVQ